MRLLAVSAVLVAAAAAASPPAPGEAAKLVARLNDPDYEEREAATRRLEELGAAAVDALRAGCRSDDPETARRARDVLVKVERRLANEKALAPTLVELDVTDRPLDSALADLSKQAGCEVVLGGAKPDDLAARKVTVSTGGKVPFWEAVLRVCDAGRVRVAGAGGFQAPGAMTYLPRAGRGVRVAPDVRKAVVLEDRGEEKPRPAAVRGAVLVEALPLAAADRPVALLQAWPEPRLAWEATTGVRVVRATDPAGGRLAAAGAVARTGEPVGADGVVLVGNPDGSAALVRDPGAVFELAGAFRPNVRQAVVRLAPAEKGGPAPREAKELAVTLSATARTGVEPLCRVDGLEADKAGAAGGRDGADLSVRYAADRGRFVASVELSYDPKAVHPAGAGDELPGVKGGGAGFGNHTVHGVRVTDAAGKPYTLGLRGGANQFDPTGRRVVMALTLELHPGRDEIGPPAVVTFWGTAARPVEVAVVLKDVPLGGGK
ncbi:MAG: hypothetical protein C0501_00415 [Isosphaera sp.]|nr:hypothetical protein [Isosphaera sp.]